MSLSLWVLQVAGQEILLLLDQRDFQVVHHGSFAMKKVLLAGEEDVHSVSGHTKNIASVFINVFLKIDDLFGSGQKCCLICLCLRVSLEGFPVEIRIQFLPVEEEKTDLIKVLMLQSHAEVWETLMSSKEGPMFPDGMVKDRNMHLVADVE